MGTIFNDIFIRLQKIGILDDAGIMQKEYMKFKSPGLMDLNVDNLLNNTIALAHDGIQNGDIMADPDMEVKIFPDLKAAEALSFQNDYVGVYQQVYDDGKCNEKLKKELNEFLVEWLQNITECGYKLVEEEG